MPWRSVSGFLLVLAALFLAGCGSPAPQFRRYSTYMHRAELETGVENFRLSSQLKQDVDESLAAMFGTPDEPALPSLEDVDVSQVIDIENLKIAAGPVGSDEFGNPRGLYREHCAHCHGISGDGAGPTSAFLNPYPRDFRPGKFKFKSTPIGFKPTHDDLKRTVLEGIPGTAMPSFKLLPDQEVEALVDYAKYLAIRGEAERSLLKMAAELQAELEGAARLVQVVPENASAEQKTLQQEQLAAVKEQVAAVVGKWVNTESNATEIPPRPVMNAEQLAESRRIGRDLFYGAIANCVKCHGDSALGDGQTTDYDDWAKEFIGDGKNTAVVRQYVALGLPEPRRIRPRNLRSGNYRGGRRPIDLYWRIRNGIEGVPMPASTMKPEGDPNAKGLTPDDIWHLVNYVESLPYESISNPLEAAQASDLRERM